MSGHNKWSTIKHKKEKTDAQRGKIFTKIGREIAIAVREGGPDPSTNSKLKDVVAKAKAANMPNENIQRSIKKASGEGDAAQYKEITYEGYAPGGVAVIVELVTDNLNRTASEVRHIFDKCGGSLGATGCVSWKFERKGVIEIDNAKGLDEDELMMLALDAGAADVESDGDVAVIYTDPNDLSAVRDSLEAAGCTFLSAEREMVPTTTTEVSDPERSPRCASSSTGWRTTTTPRTSSTTRSFPRRKRRSSMRSRTRSACWIRAWAVWAFVRALTQRRCRASGFDLLSATTPTPPTAHGRRRRSARCRCGAAQTLLRARRQGAGRRLQHGQLRRGRHAQTAPSHPRGGRGAGPCRRPRTRRKQARDRLCHAGERWPCPCTGICASAFARRPSPSPRRNW